MERVTRKPSVPLFGATANPSPDAHRKASSGPPEATDPPDDKPPGPRPKGAKRARYNLTVRLSPDERDALESIGRSVGRPSPLTLAETVRYLIRQHKAR